MKRNSVTRVKEILGSDVVPVRLSTALHALSKENIKSVFVVMIIEFEVNTLVKFNGLVLKVDLSKRVNRIAIVVVGGHGIYLRERPRRVR